MDKKEKKNIKAQENEQNVTPEELNPDENVETQENAEDTEGKEETEDTDAPKDPEDALADAEIQIAQLKDQLLRSIADFDNYRKRTLKEKTELILNGSEKAVTAILPILDDMERAIANEDKVEDVKTLNEGWELIYNKFMKVLEGMGVKKIDTTDSDFDVDYHEAIAMVPGMGDDKKGKVIDCVQTGYTLNDKVIRHAKVAVGQ
ncbi:MAG: nucleotide exchange factor GrpE [Prevotella sp.]|nr:nucleotide exchange factor GrpE [Prevotella sp.]MCR5152695.1 nucleotide exchange factor GrpE [Prevotella sp.]